MPSEIDVPEKTARTIVFKFICSLLQLLCLATVAVPASAQELWAHRVDKTKVFVAGFSSGAFMAVQMHVAFSGLLRGAAIYAGGPDGCAQGRVALAVTSCLSNEPAVDSAALTRAVRGWEAAGKVDPLRNIKGQPVYLWSGRKDTVVQQPVMDALRDMYLQLGANVFEYDRGFDAEHGWESPDGTAPCSVISKPFVVRCTEAAASVRNNLSGEPIYDSEAVWLGRWLGALRPRRVGDLRGRLLPFSQDSFAPSNDASAVGLARTGYVFVPDECRGSQVCRVLMVLHGCNQSFGAVGSAFIDQAGINPWADPNRLIVVYPQTTTTASNPEGCWDWWGYLGRSDYAVRTGPQMEMLHAILNRLLGGRESASIKSHSRRAVSAGSSWLRITGSSQPLQQHRQPSTEVAAPS